MDRFRSILQEHGRHAEQRSERLVSGPRYLSVAFFTEAERDPRWPELLAAYFYTVLAKNLYYDETERARNMNGSTAINRTRVPSGRVKPRQLGLPSRHRE